MKLATPEQIDEVYGLYRKYSEYFPHVRKTKVEYFVNNHRMVYDRGVAISFTIYRRKGYLGNCTIPRYDCMLHQIINESQGNGIIYEVFSDFANTVGKTIWCTVRTENIRSLKFMDKVGFEKVGDIAWGKTKQIPGVILKRKFTMNGNSQ